MRARLFAEKGLLEVVDEDSLSPEALARAIDRAAARPRPPAPEIDLDGARRTAELVARWTA
jgi:predicted glycosyltransferase